MLLLLLIAALQSAPDILVADLDSFPVPKNAVLDREKTNDFAKYEVESGGIQDNALSRVRVYMVPSTAAEVAAFYKKTFSTLELGKPQKSEKTEKLEIAMYAYAFRSTASGWELIKPTPEEPKDGLVLAVTEIRGDGDPHCMLIVQTLRQVK